MILLLTVLFFASVNIGSLKVGVPDILQGMIGKGSEEVSTVFDLRLPRIFISILAGAATAVSGVLFQAVLKIHWQIRESSEFPAVQPLPQF